MISQKTARRVGLIVPSSNVTMETEIPALLRAREDILPDHFTFHSSRMRMKNVTKEELERMDDDSLRCAVELSDAAVEVQAYACLVAIMSRGHGYHNTCAKRLFDASAANGSPTPTVSSAGASVTLSEHSLRKYLKLLPDFDDIEAEEQALDIAEKIFLPQHLAGTTLD